MLAIAGNITTENLGVEHLVKNVIANPFIRHLVLFGTEIQGHLPGDAFLSLHENGADPNGRINRARGARPVLKNLTQLEIEQLMSQGQILNLVGNTDLALLVTRVAELETSMIATRGDCRSIWSKPREPNQRVD